MVRIIVGNKGKGKTKFLLDKANSEVRDVLGNVVFLDKNTSHMYELNNKIRLIVVPDYQIEGADEFVGFISGIISQDHDLQQVYLDSFLQIACIGEGMSIEHTLEKLSKLSEKFGVDFVLSVSMDESELPASARSLAEIVAL